MTRIPVRVSALCIVLCLAACPAKRKSDEQSPSPTASGEQCIPEQKPTTPDLPWKNAAELCAEADRGQPWTDADPPLGPGWVTESDKYAERVQAFLRSFAYRSAPLNWLHDASWRLTGPYQGCPPDGHDKGPHPAVRIYYSPEVIDWMCRYRQGENQLPDAADMPDGAMIIKEMISVSDVALARIPGTDKLWIKPMPDKPADYYDQNVQSWTIMIKDKQGAADGWYSAFFAGTGTGNPPMWDRAAFAEQPFPGSDGKPVTQPPGNQWYPTYWQYSLNDVQFPNYEFGNYCVYCHASAQGQNTFSSFTNILGQEIRYAWLPDKPKGVDVASHPQLAATRSRPDKNPRDPFPMPRPYGEPLSGFAETFPELNPSYEEVWATRLPAQTWDHAQSLVGVEGVPLEASQFLTSDQCLGCHEAGGGGQLRVPYMVVEKGANQIDLSPYAEWSVSPMGLAGRDPIFHAQLELERNIASDQPGLASIRDCIDNTCLHCHGAPGARQYNIDTAGKGPANDPCKAFLPPADQRVATNYDGALFTRDMVMAWRDEQPDKARYGALARDGINCTICHHIADKDLDPVNLPKTFTGNYRVGSPDKVYGPFPNPESPAEVLPKPMQNALSITPEFGQQVAGSEMCGTCHTVFLPVFDDRGELAGTAYEQTTYLEWLLSSFAWGDGQKSCQDCHMPHSYQGEDLDTGIANIQDSRYPEADFLMPDKDVDNPKRSYNRHGLYGLNAFLNAFFQQFPLLLGYRQQDYMNASVRAPLLTGRETVLQVARAETATLTVTEPTVTDNTLETTVTVSNLGGHQLPSGVGFRRLFIELVVLDSSDKVLWASGQTNDIGVIVDDKGQPLPTEFWNEGPDGLPFQPHYQVIEKSDQVQIYEEASQNSSLQFTSSFIHRYWEIKDNRLRARGWNPSRIADPGRREEYGGATEPGTGPNRHWWPLPKRDLKYRNPKFPAIAKYRDTLGDPDYDLAKHAGNGLPGTDSLIYRIALTAEQRAAASKVRVTLYSQSTPPHYLKERFVYAAKDGAEKGAAQRLYFMAGHLNTKATADDGKPYLDGYKLRVGEAVEQAVKTP